MEATKEKKPEILSDAQMEYMLKYQFPTPWDLEAVDDLIITMETAGYFEKELTKGKKSIQKLKAETKLKMLKAKSLRIDPQLANEKIYIIDGKATCMTELQMALIKRDCPKSVILIKEKNEKRCVIHAKRPEDPAYTEFVYTIEKAKKQQFYKTNADKWTTMPDTMLYNRCAAEMGRQMFALELHGMSYTPDELGAKLNDDGEVVEVPDTPIETPMPSKKSTSRTEVIKQQESVPQTPIPAPSSDQTQIIENKPNPVEPENPFEEADQEALDQLNQQEANEKPTFEQWINALKSEGTGKDVMRFVPGFIGKTTEKAVQFKPSLGVETFLPKSMIKAFEPLDEGLWIKEWLIAKSPEKFGF